MTLAEILALLARHNELTTDERTELNAALSDLSAFSADELTELAGALAATADTILDGDLDDDALLALEFIALSSDAITSETTDRAAAEQERQDRAEELAGRIRANAADDGGEPAAESDEPPAEDPPADDAEPVADETPAEEPASDEAPVPVAAAASTPTTVTRVAARRPAAVAPRARQSTVVPLTASANVPNQTMGARLDTPQRLASAFAATVGAMGSMSLRPGMRIPVATAAIEFPDEGFLDGNARGNATKLDRVIAPEAITAAGGICAPPTPRYDYPTQVSSAARPVRDALVRYGADRGGVLLPSVPVISDLDGAVSFWTTTQDEAALEDPDVRKPCLRVDCGDDELVELYAVVQCLEFGNFNSRTWPERIERFTQLATSWQARQADSALLTRIGTLSTAVTVAQNLGTARDVLTGLDLAAAGMRSRHRMDPSTPLRFMAPATLMDQMRADLAREMPGSSDERLATADATLGSFFAARNINVTWFLDGEAGQIFGAQTDGVLDGWRPNVVTYLFPEGSFVYLDGGELNLGVVRDSELNSRNDWQMFAEIFENVAFYGVESLRITFELCPTGAAAGTVEPVCTDVATS